jgi:tRNA (guanine37-N1)-methyltransferase
MKFSIITLFPQIFDAFANVGVIGRAVGKGIAEIECINPRDFAENSHGCVDKRPFGGGPGMIMMAEPLKKKVSWQSRKGI